MSGERGPCEGCGKDPRVLTRIDSGQMVCRTCLREIRPPRPKHLATWKQIEYARSLGFDVPADMPRAEMDALLNGIDTTAYFLMDVWEQETGRRPKDDGIDYLKIRALAIQMASERALIDWIVATHERREQEGSRKALAAYERNPDDPRSQREFRPKYPRSECYLMIVELLRRQFGLRR